jgi:acyl-CoA synthetase (NDP forming)
VSSPEDYTNTGLMFGPRSVAVIGASRSPESFGSRLAANLRRGGFAGRIYLVNPKYQQIAGERSYRTIKDIDAPIDVAFLAVSHRNAAEVIEDCAAKGVKMAIVFSAGYAEAGAEGAGAQHELAALARRAGVRLLGPNCTGFVSVPGRVFATPSGEALTVPEGGISVVTQSGYVGLETILGRGRDAGLGFRHVITTGNEADLDCAEVMSWFAADSGTTVVVSYLEGLKDLDRFARSAAELRRAGKPLVLLRAGRSEAGRRAAHVHVGLPAVSDAAMQRVCDEHAVLQVDDIDDLWEFAGLLSAGVRIAGPNVAVIGTSGGINALITDHLCRVGLAVPRLTTATRTELAGLLPPSCHPDNPLDLTGYFTGAGRLDVYPQIAKIVGADPGVDAVIFAVQTDLSTPLETLIPGLLEKLQRVAAPVIVLSGGSSPVRNALACLQGTSIPVFWSPARCARLLKMLHDSEQR